MLDWMFALLFMLGILFIIISLANQSNAFWNIVPLVFAIALFFILALSQMEIEIPYTIFNASSGNIETGYQTFTSPISPFLSYIFVAIAILLMIYLVAMIYDKYMDLKGRR